MHALYQKKDEGRSFASTHVRTLVWSEAPIAKVAYRIDDGDWVRMHHVNGPLYVAAWDPKLYSVGPHRISVYVKDISGTERTVEQPFTFDGSRPDFRFWPRVFLMSNISSVFQFLFGCSLCVCILLLCSLKFLHHVTSKGDSRNICRRGIFRLAGCRRLLRMLWLFCAADEIFWPVITYLLYLPFGPWLAGEFLDNEFGVVFSWGLFVNRSFLPGSLTYAYGFALIVFYVIPLIVGVSYSVDVTVRRLFLQCEYSFFRQGLRQLPVALPIAVQAYLSYLMFLAYGWTSLAVGPIRSWSVVLGLYLWLQAERLSPVRMRRAALMWYGDRANYSYPLDFSSDNGDGAGEWLKKEDSNEKDIIDKINKKNQNGGGECSAEESAVSQSSEPQTAAGGFRENSSNADVKL